jgi:hypothetical protein
MTRMTPTPHTATVPADRAAYERHYPYHAELCALTEIRKKPGFGVKLSSGIGGHCLLYLNGVQLDPAAGYPILQLAPAAAPAGHGAGISVNAHYKNANWVAATGRDFIFMGALEPGERLTRDAYERTQRLAKAKGVLDGIEFHDHLFRDKPAGMSNRDFMYEISIATDYAARFGRDTMHARIPLDRRRMGAIVDYLNALNAPYRDGARIFKWRVLNNNCAHVTHNALAAAGIWKPWPTGQFFARAAWYFPVPKNQFVDLMRRTNDLPVGNAEAMYEDLAARRALLEGGTLPTAPGALAFAAQAIQDNDLYDIARLRLIFFDNPFWGPYRFQLARIFREKRYSDRHENLLHFAGVYAAARQRGAAPSGNTERARFQRAYDNYIAAQANTVRQQLAALAPAAPQTATAS